MQFSENHFRLLDCRFTGNAGGNRKSKMGGNAKTGLAARLRFLAPRIGLISNSVSRTGREDNAHARRVGAASPCGVSLIRALPLSRQYWTFLARRAILFLPNNIAKRLAMLGHISPQFRPVSGAGHLLRSSHCCALHS